MKNFQYVEDILTEDGFLGWYFKENQAAIDGWEKWMQSNPSHKGLVQEAIHFLQQMPAETRPLAEQRIEEKLQELRNRIQAAEAIPTPIIPMMNTRSAWWTIAAAVVLILAGILVFLRLNSGKQQLKAEYAQISPNTLPDGSTMILNANSKATLGKQWTGEGDREIWLEGEAFFKVNSTPNRNRFIVHSADLDVIVTGTQFNVATRHGKSNVYLQEGHVMLRESGGTEMPLEPGDYAELREKKLMKKAAREENILAWKDNKMSFENTSLTEAVQTIEDHYGITIGLADDKLGSKSLTGIMPNNKLEDLLSAIEVAADVDIRRTNDNNFIISDNK